ncbi:Sterol O-acyltransferase 2 (Sterol-ester synthase 2) [Taxawa tesnikishii (nom. ined.)]|nr:Sterol O-acyltransferase 2 (Sterol-ester synthase 2) [Dothideales sp. JES 119]
MVLMFLRVSAHNYRDYGSIFGRNEIIKIMFGREVVVLGITDLVMCLATSFGVFLHKAILKGYINWNRSGWIIQNLWQSFYLAAVVGWMLYREWPWTHTIFIILHTMVFLMKQHSYSFYNGFLSGVYRRKKMLEKKLVQLQDMQSSASAPDSPYGPGPTSVSSSALEQSSSLPQRRRSMGPRTSTNLGTETSDVAHVASAMDSGEPLNDSQMQAFERILKSEIDGLDKDLRGKCPSGSNKYPKTLRFAIGPTGSVFQLWYTNLSIHGKNA